MKGYTRGCAAFRAVSLRLTETVPSFRGSPLLLLRERRRRSLVEKKTLFGKP
jgi:hypothetical protein